LSLTNQSAQPAPAGLGWHPFFMKRARSHLSFNSTGRWEMGEDKLPTHRVPSGGIDADCAALDVDHCYDGWRGEVRLRDDLFDIRIGSNLTRLVVFTTPDRDCVAIEPVSHVNNAMALAASGQDPAGLGLATLQPGESLSAQMTIAVGLVK
jgi:aldose 1-epimerase